MDNIKYFSENNFADSLSTFFKDLNIPVDTLTKEPTTADKIIDSYSPDNESHQLIEDIYPFGLINDAIFSGDDSLETVYEIKSFKKDYNGLFIFGVNLKQRENNLLPTRSQLTNITRSINKSFPYTPITVVFKYKDDKREYIAFANGERTKYVQNWREGEKIGTVSILKDIRIEKTHTAHLRILNTLIIDRNKINNFSSLYEYWQKVFSTKTLTKQFYNDLSDWYFWAIDNVTFPSENELQTRDEKIQHKSKNVIRLLTRILFVWFLKQKKLIPKELFDEDYLSNNLLKDFNPHNAKGLFNHKSLDSTYYKAIMQNLFFATLNCPILPTSKEDNRERGFRKKDNYGQHRDANFLMRYKDFFSNPNHFLELVNSKVPFLNGGLFDCLDDKTAKTPIYIDGFSDNLISPHQLIVPDYLFFGNEKGRGINQSDIYNDKSKKSVDIKGLIDILKSYYFTVEENTPYDQEISLDPELLGKVFENLLASYNPETKSTARKQSGSFYTPKEIVQYMVDESLIAHIKNEISEELEVEIRKLLSYSEIESNLSEEDKQKIIELIFKSKILDPACGSGAFPMGILQQMVHILRKLDFDNKYWFKLAKQQALKESEDVLNSSKTEKEELLREVGHNFDQNMNSADYARKLYVIENSIYGVDIQPIAVQISKLRFFISLVVEQKSSGEPENNFNIRPLPNLEAKFVAANTLIGIKRETGQRSLFDTEKLEEIQNELKSNRHKIFSSKTPKTKRDRKNKDIELRKELADLLESYGEVDNETANNLASWDMFNQNTTSPFFDTEWMFGIKDGFDIVIGNPPYIQLQENKGILANMYENQNFFTFARTGDIYSLFYELGINLLKTQGLEILITSNKWMRAGYGEKLRGFFYKHNPIKLIDLGSGVFENATVDTNVLIIKKEEYTNSLLATSIKTKNKDLSNLEFLHTEVKDSEIWTILNPIELSIKKKIESVGTPLKDWDIKINYGIKTGCNEAFIISGEKKEEILANCQTEEERKRTDELIRPILRGRDIKRYSYEFADLWLINTHNGIRSKGIRPIEIEDYPAVKEHLDTYWKRIEKRDDQGSTPYNLRNCAYMEEFSKQKIAWSETNDLINTKITFDSQNYILDKTCFLLTTTDDKKINIIYNILSSKIFTFYMKFSSPILGSSGISLTKESVELFPCININNLTLHEIYTTYKLTKEEIEYINKD